MTAPVAVIRHVFQCANSSKGHHHFCASMHVEQKTPWALCRSKFRLYLILRILFRAEAIAAKGVDNRRIRTCARTHTQAHTCHCGMFYPLQRAMYLDIIDCLHAPGIFNLLTRDHTGIFVVVK